MKMVVVKMKMVTVWCGFIRAYAEIEPSHVQGQFEAVPQLSRV